MIAAKRDTIFSAVSRYGFTLIIQYFSSKRTVFGVYIYKQPVLCILNSISGNYSVLLSASGK